MDGRTRREELRLRTGEALAGLAEPTPRIGGPQSGDLYLLDSSEDLEWLVLFRAAGSCLVVPADSLPFTGSRDVAVPRGAASGPLNLRCAFAVWVEVERLETATRSGSLDAGSVAKARARLDSESGLPAQRAVDRDPEYEDWNREVLAAGRDALRVERPRLPARRSSRFVPLALAAALLSAVVGMAVLQQRVESLGQPSFDVPRHDLDFGRPRDGTVLEVEPGSAYILLPLAIRRVDRYDHYFVEIIDERSERVWRSPIRERQTQYRLLVPRRLLPDGTYRFRLYGMRDGAEVFVGELERTFIERIDDP